MAQTVNHQHPFTVATLLSTDIRREHGSTRGVHQIRHGLEQVRGQHQTLAGVPATAQQHDHILPEHGQHPQHQQTARMVAVVGGHGHRFTGHQLAHAGMGQSGLQETAYQTPGQDTVQEIQAHGTSTMARVPAEEPGSQSIS